MKHQLLQFFKRFFLPVIYLSCPALFSQTNLTVLGHYTFPGPVTCANLTGYVDSLGREYALVGTSQGLSIIALDTPSTPRQLFLVPGATGQGGFWREVREYKGYAYVTTEESSGLVVVNLRYLPDSIQYHTVKPGGMNTSHTIFIDSNGIAYVNGTDKGQLFLDLNVDPYNPTLIGKFNNSYVHDCFARNDTLWNACINEGVIKVVDVRNKATANDSASNIASWDTPLFFSHNCWLSDDSKFLFTTDEKPNSTLTCYNVSNLANVAEMDKTQVNPGSNTIIHNTYFLNNYCISSYYTYGISIHDVTRKNNLVEVGHFDTSPNFSGDGFHGAWGVWPYLPSGNIIVSDIETGLWILKPVYKRGCYLEGVVRDSICNTFLQDVKIEIVGSGTSDLTVFPGKYSTGTPDSGTFTIRFSKNGYQSRDVTNVSLKNGLLTTVNVNLVPLSTSHLVVKTIDAVTGNDLPFVRILIQDTSGATNQEIATRSNAEFDICDFVQGNYNFYAGRWGRITAKVSANIARLADTIIIPVSTGYYDDFIMDYGWTVTTTSATGNWERGEPAGTMYQGSASNPNLDIADDFGKDCFVTGNNGGGAGDDDVDSGYTMLRSPFFDLLSFQDPYLSYYRWFFNDGGTGSAPNDSLLIYLSNGIDTMLIDFAGADSFQSRWIYKNIRVKNFLPLTPNMRIFLKVEDRTPGHLVESGFDVFMVVDSGIVSGLKPGNSEFSFRIYPNPATDHLVVEKRTASPATLFVLDMSGRTVLKVLIGERKNTIPINGLSKGIYLVKLFEDGIPVGERKFAKTE